MAAVAYIHLKTFFYIIYLNCIRYGSVRRILITIPAAVILLVFWLILLVFRLLDEILFFNYRKTTIKQPVFIIGNPRSGTTYMHRLMSLDEERYVTMKLYHTILPAVSFYKLVQVLGKIDRKIGRPLRRFFDWIDSWFFKEWKNIHPTGFNHTDEDEGLYVFSFLTVAVSLFCPYMQHFKYLTIIDDLPVKSRLRLQNYFRSSLQRFMYVEGKGKTLLTKNVITTGRLNTILEILPDAQMVYMVRDPRKSIPSYISMFSATWQFLAPELDKKSAPYQALAQIGIDFYRYFHSQKSKYIGTGFTTVKYDELMKYPLKTVLEIYDYFNLPVSKNFKVQLKKSIAQQQNYNSKHQYTLEQYGLTSAYIESQLNEFMLDYEFNEYAGFNEKYTI